MTFAPPPGPPAVSPCACAGAKSLSGGAYLGAISVDEANDSSLKDCLSRLCFK